MTKQKPTYEELEYKLGNRRGIIIVLSFFLIVFIVSYIFYGVVTEKRLGDLQQENLALKEQIGFQGYNISFTCYGVERVDWVFKSYKDYENIRWFIEKRGCEVLP